MECRTKVRGPMDNSMVMEQIEEKSQSIKSEDKCQGSTSESKLPNPPVTLEDLQMKEAELTKSLADLEREIYATEGRNLVEVAIL